MTQCKTPREMLKNLLESINLLMEGYAKFSKENKELEADQSLLAFVYLLLIARPEMLISCFKYYFLNL